MDDISVHWYVSIIVAEAGLEPAISAYETERITIFHIPRYIYNNPNNEPIKYKPITTNPTLKLLTIDSIKISFKSFILYTFVVWEWNRTIGTRGFNPLLYLLRYHTNYL